MTSCTIGYGITVSRRNRARATRTIPTMFSAWTLAPATTGWWPTAVGTPKPACSASAGRASLLLVRLVDDGRAGRSRRVPESAARLAAAGLNGRGKPVRGRRLGRLRRLTVVPGDRFCRLFRGLRFAGLSNDEEIIDYRLDTSQEIVVTTTPFPQCLLNIAYFLMKLCV